MTTTASELTTTHHIRFASKLRIEPKSTAVPASPLADDRLDVNNSKEQDAETEDPREHCTDGDVVGPAPAAEYAEEEAIPITPAKSPTRRSMPAASAPGAPAKAT